jgi:hypothetical protein
MLHRVAVSALVILAVTIAASPANGQVSGATLSGTITDPSGAAIGGAKISIANKATGVNRDVTTDAAGFYSAPNLLPGLYDVTASASGFSTAKQAGVTLTVGAQQTLNLPLKIGEASQTVEVTGAALLVQLGSSTISSEVDSKQILEIPLNGRDWASLATLSPGVNAVNVQMPFETGARRGNRGFGAQLTISGGKPSQNNYRLDGLSINDYAQGGPGSVLGVNLGVDAIAEFSVITGNYSAEYGRTSGGIVNAISKSGTNAFHGDIYEFLRNQKLDANDFFTNSVGGAKPVYRRNQFGAAVGGPIRRDRTFFFFDYEGVRQTQALPSGNSRVPSDNARLGHLVSGNINVDPLAAKYLALFPHSNGRVTGDVGRFIFPLTGVIQEDYYTARGDHKISDKDSLFMTYTYDKTPDTNPDAFNNVLDVSKTTRHIAALEENHIFSPTLVNSARLGFNRSAVINTQPTAAINPASADPSLGMMLGRNAPALFISGLSQLPGGFPGGASVHVWNSYQFYDDAFVTRGTHSLKLGFAVERMQYNPFAIYNPNGIVRASLKNFLTNNIASFEGTDPAHLTPRGYRQTLFGGYIQDDWKVRRKLTLNVGLRYEMTTVLNEVEGKLTNLRNITDPVPYCGTTDPVLTNVFGKAGCTGVAPYYSNPTTKNFEPRFGFAYDPRGDGKTAIRGGFAIFDVLPLPGYYFSQSWAPFLLVGTVSTGLAGTLGLPPSSPGSAFSKLGPTKDPACTSPLGTCTLTAGYSEPNPRRNYVEQWNINVQRQITSSLTATVGYIGSHGVHMVIRGDDFNMVIPKLTSAGWLWPANSTPAMRINPSMGIIRGMSFGTGSTYEALTVNVQKRLSHGFQFGGSYTYGKSRDDDSATVLGDAFSNSITTWFPFAPQISRAPSDYNVTHTAVINGIWQVPGPRAGVARAVLGGWEMGGVLKMNSGVPTTPIFGDDVLGVQNSGSDPFSIPDRVPGCDPVNHNFKSDPNLTYINTSCFKVPMATPEIKSQCAPFSAVPGSCRNLLGNAGRNSIVGPSLYNLDFSVFKNFAVRKISESFNVQFRAEFFNILNHANFGVPLDFTGGGTAVLFDASGSVASGAGGISQPLITKPRDIQFALKVIF